VLDSFVIAGLQPTVACFLYPMFGILL